MVNENKDLFYQEGQQPTSINNVKHEIITKHTKPINN